MDKELKILDQQDLEQYDKKKNTSSISGKELLIYLSGFPNGISNIDFIHPVEFIFDSVIRTVKIEKVTFRHRFVIGDLESTENLIGLKFELCDFKKYFSFDDRNKASLFNIISFNDCKFNSTTIFNGINSDQLNFNPSPNSGCSFENNVFFRNIRADISFIHTNFNGTTNLTDLSADSNIKISKGVISGDIRINSHFSNIEIKSLIVKKTDSIIPKIDIFSKNKNKTSTIKITKIKNLDELIISGEDESELKTIEIDKYYMSSGVQGIFLLYNLKVGKFEYKSSTITPKISINNTTFNYLKFDDVNLGNAIFNNSIIKKLEITGTVFDDCKFNGCELPGKIEELKDNDIMKDNYRQLKFSMDKNGNHTEANKFFVKEMEYYGKTLKLFSKDFFNKSLHSTQWLISNFGNSWIRAFFWLIFLSLLAWGIDFGYSSQFDRIMPNNYFIQYLNPVFILPTENIIYNWIEQLSFIVFKLLYAIIFYQLIIAARRTTKR